MAKRFWPYRNEGDALFKEQYRLFGEAALAFIEGKGPRPTKPDGGFVSDKVINLAATDFLLIAADEAAKAAKAAADDAKGN